VLGRDPLSFTAEIATESVGDLKIAGHAWTYSTGGLG